MRLIGLLALLVVLATPAWAQRHDQGSVAEANAAIELCRRAGGTRNVCLMKNVPEDSAVALAKIALDQCDVYDSQNFSWVFWDAMHKTCKVERAYIKQRWGY